MNRKTLKAAFPYTVPVMAGYVFLGFAFGLLMISKDAPLWVPVLMSLAIYSGALEFAAVPFFFTAPDLIGSFVLGLLLSIRHIFYGIPMLEKYADAGKLKIPMIFWLTDETFSISSTIDAPEDVDKTGFYAWIGLLDYLYWACGTTAGALFGNVVKLNLAGLDFALTALFIVLFIEQFKGREGKFGGMCGIGATVIALAIAGSGNMVPVALVIILTSLLVGRRWIDHE